MSLISVVIPVYNAQATLERCLDGLLAQSHPAWEAILVNDGSTDASGEVLRRYAQCDPRFVVLEQPNAGPAAARNTGMRHARGEWLAFVDADDVIPPDYLQQLRQACCAGCALVVCSVRRLTQNSCTAEHRSEPRQYSAAEYARALLAREVDYLTAHGSWAKLYRLETVRANGLLMEERYRRGEDALFNRLYVAALRPEDTVWTTDATWYGYCEQAVSLTTAYLDTIPAAQAALARAADALCTAFSLWDEAAQGALRKEQYLNFAWTVQTVLTARLSLRQTLQQLQTVLELEILTPEQLMQVKGGGRAWQLLSRILQWRSAPLLWAWMMFRTL